MSDSDSGPEEPMETNVFYFNIFLFGFTYF